MSVVSLYSDLKLLSPFLIVSPVNPLPVLSNDNWHGLPLDVAFFAFAKRQNSFQQYIAARSLQKNNWKYEANERKWYFQSSAIRVSIEEGNKE